MNLLFLYPLAFNSLNGGVERTTYLLANYLESKGFNIFFLSLLDNNPAKDKRQFLLPDKSLMNSEINILFYRSFLKEKSINVVINKGGTDPATSLLSYHCKIDRIHLISNVHNSLLGSMKNFKASQHPKFRRIGMGWLLPITDNKSVKNLILNLFKYKYKNHYTSLCKNSDYVILESDKFKEELRFLMDGQSIKNVLGISNFVSFSNVVQVEKKRELLYVGRINTSQKRVDLLLKIWASLHTKFPDWSLNVVGGGDELESIKSLSSELKLNNITFHGFKIAKPFYETASVICMTSSYEGFGIALIEAMQYGAVPIAFNSYLSVTDIVEDRVNGRLITPFKINEYSDVLADLMSSQKKLERLSAAAKHSVRKFDLSIIGEQWITLFKKLNNG